VLLPISNMYKSVQWGCCVKPINSTFHECIHEAAGFTVLVDSSLLSWRHRPPASATWHDGRCGWGPLDYDYWHCRTLCGARSICNCRASVRFCLCSSVRLSHPAAARRCCRPDGQEIIMLHGRRSAAARRSSGVRRPSMCIDGARMRAVPRCQPT